MCLSSAEETEHQLHVLEVTTVELKAGVVHTLGLHPEKVTQVVADVSAAESLGSMWVLMLQCLTIVLKQ